MTSRARVGQDAPRAARRTSKGRVAWDKDRTRELFRRYKGEGDTEARDQLIMSHLNLVRFLASKLVDRLSTHSPFLIQRKRNERKNRGYP